MGPLDALLLKLLANNPPLVPEEARNVQKWWLANRNPRESLTDFLVRQEIFNADANKTIDLLRKGLITFCDPRRLFVQQGLERLRARIASVATTTPAKPPSQANIKLPPSDRPQKQTSDTAHVLSDNTDRGTPTSTPQIGTMLGKCLLTEQIGKGGSAQVFRAIHRGLNIPVAVKVLKREALESDPGVYAQLKAEANLLSKLEHRNIIRILEFEDNPKFPYLVLEYVEGLSLNELIAQSGRLRCDRAVQIIKQVADGLKAALQLGVIHRDVKPANILLTRDGSPKLADMGLAMVIGGPVQTNTSASSTSLEMMAGTVAYISPEQALSSPGLDHRADIYSLGATFYHAITGDFPFKGRTRMEVILKHVQETPPAPHTVVPGLDSSASDIILKMMAKDPKDRFQDYQQLLQALDSINLRHDSSMGMSTTSQNPAVTMKR